MIDSGQINERISSFVVRNANFYRDKWQKFQEQPGSYLSFNWAAVFFGPIWLLYRKVYVPLFWIVLVLVADVALWFYIEDQVSETLSMLWNGISTILWVGVFGFLSNYWYWGRFVKVEQQAVARHAGTEGQLQYLRSKGGTSPLVALLILVVLLVPTLWGSYWAYQGYRAGVVLNASGPLTLDEINANYLQFMDDPLTGLRQECVYREITERARAAGDPENLNPAAVEGLRADDWDRLDAQDKRFELSEAIFTQAMLNCVRPGTR